MRRLFFQGDGQFLDGQFLILVQFLGIVTLTVTKRSPAACLRWRARRDRARASSSRLRAGGHLQRHGSSSVGTSTVVPSIAA